MTAESQFLSLTWWMSAGPTPIVAAFAALLAFLGVGRTIRYNRSKDRKEREHERHALATALFAEFIVTDRSLSTLAGSVRQVIEDCFGSLPAALSGAPPTVQPYDGIQFARILDAVEPPFAHIVKELRKDLGTLRDPALVSLIYQSDATLNDLVRRVRDIRTPADLQYYAQHSYQILFTGWIRVHVCLIGLARIMKSTPGQIAAIERDLARIQALYAEVQRPLDIRLPPHWPGQAD